MVRTKSRVTSPGPQESRDASSNPHHDRQSASGEGDGLDEEGHG